MPEVTAAVHSDLSDQVAIVTGGGRGLGSVFATALAEAGASVAVVARSSEHLAETVAKITRAGGRGLALPTDVTNQRAVERAVTAVERQFGPVDLLVNNAGITTPVGLAWDVEPDEWWRCVETNLRGPFLCSRAVVPMMIARRRGRIIHVASTAGLRAIAGDSAYSTSKAALVRFSEILAAETQGYDVRVFAINPGLVRTAMTEYLAASPEGRRWMPWVHEVLDAGRDIPPTAAINLVLSLAAGRGDTLTGRFISVTDDLAELTRRHAEIEQGDLYTMRLRLPPALEEPTSAGTPRRP